MLELALAAAFKATLSAPTHRPRVNRPWPIAIRATDLAGNQSDPAAVALRVVR